MKNYSHYVGIDISKNTLDVVLLNPDEKIVQKHFKIENSKEAISKFIVTLKKEHVQIDNILFCCENTGVYTYILSDCLSLKKIDLWVVPAIEIKRSKGISRGKNDKIDAKDIALYSYRNIDKLQLYKVSDANIQELKVLHSEREKIVKSIKLFGMTSENEIFIPKKIYKSTKRINAKIIKGLRKHLLDIEKQMKAIIIPNEELSNQFQLIKSIPGIGEQTALYIIITTKGFKTFKNWRQFACYSGVAPFEYSSGTSVKGRTKVSHLADKKMKSLLHMCALTAIKYDPQLKEYYNKKKAEGKNSMLVLNNIRCKIISRVFSVINRQTPYVNTYKFAC
ncbi:IS110 family RNA-guided transposase [Flavobacterium soli]|jgi:transposase|uniref:IS110 family transposase n=5 Tax=Flavobacterium soli TaxID=344881 RepID=UPI0003FB2361|nr:IS110 family transposase [Flavobacterium soli]